MTNDRRKTFATPLDWMRWALEFPGARIARTKHGIICKIVISGNEGVVSYDLNSATGVLGLSDCPLTAVEDEHGAIPEPVKERPPVTNLGEVAEWLADIGACEDPQDRRGAARQAAHFIQKLIDERIAAATVEVPFDNGTILPEWRETRYRLKPKGESK